MKLAFLYQPMAKSCKSIITGKLRISCEAVMKKPWTAVRRCQQWRIELEHEADFGTGTGTGTGTDGTYRRI
jgi:hypothetical protein